jgi:transposase
MPEPAPVTMTNLPSNRWKPIRFSSAPSVLVYSPFSSRRVPDNIVLLPLPPYAPELNSTEYIWEYLRSNWLSHCVWDTYERYSTPVAMPGMP